ncbi:hypothetical protein [Streptobacillus canis]|uniref:hypothetical protein n=1 Tax=Streptobacillus canis TaxID=2678686 RepID=UPI0012E21E92|nr:hypothetical protein [Streptobacillus canis]
MELELISNLIKLIGDNGISLVASAILLYFTSKYFKENAENQKEIIKAIILVKEKLVNGHLGNEDLKFYVRIYWIRICETYKAEMLEYLIRNNIKANYDNINIELDKKMLTIINRMKEIVRGQTNGMNLLKISDLITDNYSSLHTKCMEILKCAIEEKERNNCTSINTLCSTENIARAIKNHIDHLNVEVLEIIDGMNL